MRKGTRILVALQAGLLALMLMLGSALPASASQAAFQSISQYIASSGRPAPGADAYLNSYAQNWAQTMANAGTINVGLTNPNAPAGYNYKWRAVLMGSGEKDAMAIVEGFKSDQAKVNQMFSGSANRGGIGVAQDASGRTYVVLALVDAQAIPAVVVPPPAPVPAPVRVPAPVVEAPAPVVEAPAPEPAPVVKEPVVPAATPTPTPEPTVEAPKPTPKPKPSPTSEAKPTSTPSPAAKPSPSATPEPTPTPTPTPAVDKEKEEALKTAEQAREELDEALEEQRASAESSQQLSQGLFVGSLGVGGMGMLAFGLIPFFRLKKEEF